MGEASTEFVGHVVYSGFLCVRVFRFFGLISFGLWKLVS